MKLQNKVAIVTGSADGIGKAIAKRYIEEGASVIIADINFAKAQETAAELGEKSVPVELDITLAQSRKVMIETVVTKFGQIDILVNNAAIFNMGPLLDITEANFDIIFNVNVKGLMFMMQDVAKQMIAQGTRGRIVNFASQAGRRGEALVASYCASKAAVISLTQSAGLALARQGINVNAIAPGVVDTPMWEMVDAQFAQYENLAIGEKKRMVGEAVPYGRMGHSEDICGAAVFFASEDSEYILAQTLNVDGGN
ncbi:MAG: L-iditol 2-dehydrogenase [Ostreibacterium sp.]